MTHCIVLLIIPNEAHTDNPNDLDKELDSFVNLLTDNDKQHFYSLADCKVINIKNLKK